MQIAASDLLASIGVTLMLVPFVLNIADVLSNDSPLYIIPNIIGGILTCTAAFMVGFLPFVILEGTWALVSSWALYIYFKRDFRKNKS